MSGTKRTISIRKILQTLLTAAVISGVVLAVTAADRRQRTETLRAVQVHISNAEAVRFLDEAAVRTLLMATRGQDLTQLPLSSLELGRMEGIVRSNPWVAGAEVYVDNQRVLHVNLGQRVPMVRIFDQEGASYYLDTALKVVPLSDRYIHYAPVVTGLPKLRPDSSGQSIRAQAYYLARAIEGDPFWRAQVAQIAMLDGHDFELVPVIGKQHILIGDTSQLQAKLSRLLTFYKNVLNKIGYDKYDTLDARFSGQIVASPALRWKAPVDKALSDAVWARAIIESAPKEPEAANQEDLDPATTTAPAAAPPKPQPVVADDHRQTASPAPRREAPKPADRPAANRPKPSGNGRPAPPKASADRTDRNRPASNQRRPATTNTNRSQRHP